MTNENLKAFITSKLCCVQQKTDAGYLSISKGGKDPMCNIHYAFLANAMLYVLKCIALDEICSSINDDNGCNDIQSNLEGEWTCTEVCVADECSTEYEAAEFVALIGSTWTFSENQSEESLTYEGNVDINGELGDGTASWNVNSSNTVTTNFSFEPPDPYEGNIYIDPSNCNQMTIVFEQDGLDTVYVTLTKTEFIESAELTCEFFCLTDKEICDIVNWLNRYCWDCKDYSPKPLTTT